jgi:cytochrome c-type biogenesis protein CcmF
MDSLISRESSFLLNNLVLVGATFAIFLGTIFPVISEAVRGTKITVGAPFFNQVVGPIFLVLILLTGICVFLGWRRASTKKLIRNFLYPVIVALVLCLVLFSVGIREWYALTLFPLCVFVTGTHLFAWYREVRARGHLKVENPLKAFFGLLWANKPRYGGMLVHLSIVLIAVGVIGSSFYQVEKQAALLPGEQMTINDYALTYEGMSFYETPSKQVVTAKLSVYNGDKRVGELTPEKYFHRTHQQPVTEVAIRSTPLEDLYVILGGWDEDGTTTFVVLVNPLVSWIWVGGVVLLLGGLIAFWPDRRKQ